MIIPCLTHLHMCFHGFHLTIDETDCQKIMSNAIKIFTLIREHHYLPSIGSNLLGHIFPRRWDVYNEMDQESDGNSK